MTQDEYIYLTPEQLAHMLDELEDCVGKSGIMDREQAKAVLDKYSIYERQAFKSGEACLSS